MQNNQTADDLSPVWLYRIIFNRVSIELRWWHYFQCSWSNFLQVHITLVQTETETKMLTSDETFKCLFFNENIRCNLGFEFHWSLPQEVQGNMAASWWRHQMETFSALLALCAGISPVLVNSPHKGQWRGTLMFSLICAWINDWANNREAGDLRRHRDHHDVNVMIGLDNGLVPFGR